MFTTSPLLSLSRRMRDTDADSITPSDTENTNECAHNSTTNHGRTQSQVPSKRSCRAGIILYRVARLSTLRSFRIPVCCWARISASTVKVWSGNFVMYEYACTLLLHFRIPRLGTLAFGRAEGQLAAMEREGREWDGPGGGAGQNVALFLPSFSPALSPFVVKCAPLSAPLPCSSNVFSSFP